jgi:hypothetical protein
MATRNMRFSKSYLNLLRLAESMKATTYRQYLIRQADAQS